MTLIRQTFDDLKRRGRKGFIPFITAGDPDLRTSKDIAIALSQAGADILELGVPFSDPMADGPTIQRSSQRAIENGTDLRQVLELAAEIRKEVELPIVLFSYLNPLLSYGFENLISEKPAIDGVLVTDAVDDEAAEIRSILARTEIDLISLVAPTTSEARLERICAEASGFIYAVSRAGVTGARTDTSATAEQLVRRVRRFTDLPVAVGFGISTGEQVADVWRYADAAVVGSAIVAEIERAGNRAAAVESLRKLASTLVPAFAKTSEET
jgi:tryptophan synthase alpha chain